MLNKNSISLQAAKKAREQEEKQEGRPKKNVYRIFKREMVGIICDQCFKLCEVHLLASKASDTKSSLNWLTV